MTDALIAALEDHTPFDDEEAKARADILDFLRTTEGDPFHRSNKAGHITGSAFIIDRAGTQTVLCHHRKLDKWLQPGGHCDGDPDVLGVALRETEEETGLKETVEPVPGLFDVSVHTIPARGEEPAHFHYDIRYLLHADPADPLVLSEESFDLRWIPLQDVRRFTPFRSVLRMVEKVRANDR